MSLDMRAKLALDESRVVRMKSREALAAALELQSEHWELQCDIREASRRFLEHASQSLANPSTLGPAMSGLPTSS
jgi:hypothetical protein